MKINAEGFSGKLASFFVHSKLTPVIALFSIMMGLVSVYLTPKEEEPQISVPMIDISIGSPGLEANEIEQKVTEPIERAVWGLEGVEYVYSASEAHGALITVRFKVGEQMETSLLKIHHKMMLIKNEFPKNTTDPNIKSYSIDDVPFLTLTFSSKQKSPYELRALIAPLAREFQSTPDLSQIELLGGQKRVIRVIVDPQKSAQLGVSLLSIRQSLDQNHFNIKAGKNWSSKEVMDVEVGGLLKSSHDIENIAIGQRNGRVVYLKEVASIIDGPEVLTRASMIFLKSDKINPVDAENAVSIVFSKRKGTNVVDLSKSLLNRAQIFNSTLTNDIQMSEMRNYGSTADEKSKELIEHLLIATLSVVVLIALAMGWRASIVVALAIPVTLALTLAIYYFLGYTLNRITLFALIFSIGILVDDAIVVVENIERHLKLGKEGGILKATLHAVSEVGNPTILATFTVIAAILPMAFVRGMMGPYMKPIPVGASLAMILSLLVAFIITPWASVRILKHEQHSPSKKETLNEHSKLDGVYLKLINTFLSRKRESLKFGFMIFVLFGVAFSLVTLKKVKVKMLPFDNKNEFQILLDYPQSMPLLKTLEETKQFASQLLKNPEIQRIQIFVGEPAPFSFSGMVKHTFLRGKDYQADLQIILKDKNDRKRSSHEIIESLRPFVSEFSDRNKVVSKVLEIPPGPPVLATMVAEIYGPDEVSREKAAKEVEAVFKSEKSMVDIDSTLRNQRSRIRYGFNFTKGGELGVRAKDFALLGANLFSEQRLGILNEFNHPEEIGIDLSVKNESRSSETPFFNQSLPSFETGLVNADKLSLKPEILESKVLYRKNLKFLSYITSECSGSEEAPVYGILNLSPKINLPMQTSEVPWDTRKPLLKWDGEWFITYEVFRDLGSAFAVVIVLIYVLVLGWFKSYTVPLVIMAPIPISLIGILPGHAILGAYFTATSMIGFIAGAGIIVRNSIILVDFIEEQIKLGLPLKEAVISAGVLRFRPMLLTAAAVVVGGAVMLKDPIFQGLAISLMFGEIAATLLSRFAVPILYYWFVGKSRFIFLKGEINNDN